MTSRGSWLLLVVLNFPFHPDTCMTMTLTEQRPVLSSYQPCVSPLPHRNFCNFRRFGEKASTLACFFPWNNDIFAGEPGIPLLRTEPCLSERSCITQWSYEPCHTGLPKWRVLTKRGPLEEAIANHSNIFAVRIPPMNSMTRQKYMALADEAPRSEGIQYDTGEELISHTSKSMLKILQARLPQYVNWEIPDVQAGLRKGKRTRYLIANIHWII